jgi:endoglucanase
MQHMLKYFFAGSVGLGLVLTVWPDVIHWAPPRELGMNSKQKAWHSFAAFSEPLYSLQTSSSSDPRFTYDHGAIIRGDRKKKEIALVFTGDEFADGGPLISSTLQKQAIRASFFLTGNFYRNKAFAPLIKTLGLNGNYLGPHSDRHLLYCDWSKRDSLLVTRREFVDDLRKNLEQIRTAGISDTAACFFLPPYEWYNDSIARWTGEMGMQLVNYSPGTISTADYTYPGPPNYRSTNEIYQSITSTEAADHDHLNGFILLVHIGTDPRRTDKFYQRLDELISLLKNKGYNFKRIDELLGN